jgi:hypothetical protein
MRRQLPWEQQYQVRDPVKGEAEPRGKWSEMIHNRSRQIPNDESVEEYRNKARACTAHIRDPKNRKQRYRNHEQDPLP